LEKGTIMQAQELPPWERYKPQAQEAPPWERYRGAVASQEQQDEPSIMVDVAKSAATGLGKGTEALITAPFDLGAMAGGYLAKKAVGDSTMGIDPNGSIAKGLEYIFGKGGVAEALPSSLTEAANTAIGLTYKPQTTAGKYAETIASTAPFVAAFPSKAIASTPGIISKGTQVLKNAALIGGGSELGGQLTEGSEYEPIARLAGGLLGYGGGNYLASGAGNMGRGLIARSPDKLEATAEKMLRNAGNTYTKMREIGATFNPEKTKSIISDISNAVNSNQFIPELNPKTKAIVDHISEAAQEGTLGLDQLDQYRRLLGRIGQTEDGVSAGAVRRAIDNAVNTARKADLSSGTPEAITLLQNGRADYARASRFEDVSDVVRGANGDPNKTKAALSRFVLKEPLKKMGYSTQEINALKDAAHTGVGENLLKAFGKLGFDFSKTGTGNTIIPALLTGTSFSGNPIGAGIAGAATLARQGQKYLARGKAENALRLIEGAK
jgi:hypothetical protein